ncbi:ABC-type multidrug transport system, ATPase and permease component [Algoriphagus locisalis]|uniref:ABC-type multidrug transport system, ATPase and permease component n=1 Tax=Algoriphagus locisalis TaxID=305507 RepID=A0A1I6XUI2_9BACT|nr:ABC transporter ATP-binding protein [Algoriphagus locisalis]SFT41703.1 ABC-type multidrug transport system, ATPase and permease component [Algoriphagus locisalis]
MVNKYFKYFSFFYKNIGNRMFVSIILNFFVGILDGFGLVMFLPLLQYAEDTDMASSTEMGDLNFLLEGFELVGFEINIYSVLGVLLVFFLLKGLVKYIETYYRSIVQNEFITDIRLKAVSHLSNFNYKTFSRTDQGWIINTLSGEIVKVAAASNSYFLMLQSVIMIIVYSFLAFLANPQFSGLVIVGGILSNFVFNYFNKKTLIASRNITREGNAFQGYLTQKVSFFKYLKATGTMGIFSEKIRERLLNINSNNIKIGHYFAVLNSLREPLVMLVVVMVILFSVGFLDLSMGLIVLSLLFFYRALTFLMSFQTFYNSFLTSGGALENLHLYFDTLEMGKDVSDGGLVFSEFQSGITVNSVSFSYGEKNVLKDINITIPKNTSIAFVGESGSGKTTLTNLICGLMPYEMGTIKIDGIELSNFDIVSYQKRIGYITQEPVIFSDTFFNNVTMWAEKNSENLSKFWTAVQKSNIASYIKESDLREDTDLGDNGVMLSGGQKQRVSIARELFKSVDILIMDEATSALDSETEKVIQENIESLKGEYTLIVIAHRLSTIKNLDQVALFSGGRLLGVNNFESLMEESPKFSGMVQLQSF